MKKVISAFILFLRFINVVCQPSVHDLHFDTLARRWDEAIPLGNGTLGALVWQKGDNLRLSLDRADLWDQRPMKGLHRKEFSYQWVINQVLKKDYKPVQQYFDAPYDNEPAPTRIPGGALELEIKNWGKVVSVHLSVNDALCEVKWENGAVMKTFVHAKAPFGWFRFENVKDGFNPRLVMPEYQGAAKAAGGPVEGDDLSRLGYPPGIVKQQGNNITYEQRGWGGFKYEINVRWRKINQLTYEGAWSITSSYTHKKLHAAQITAYVLRQRYSKLFYSHVLWWHNFWKNSAIHIPDTLLEKQWYLEQYKFGSAARLGAPPISLQAVWTADNGRIPPWKGDYHHDLNTELSYWPCYSANHLDGGLSFVNYLWGNRVNYKRYTKLFFGQKGGLAVPGVTTLDGTEMGGWIQYSLSPTVSSWLAHHFYLYWRYSKDKRFLATRAYPWIASVAYFLEHITVKDRNGHRKLPISSSPEINDNDLSAWFPQDTNYDLALMQSTFQTAVELSVELGHLQQARHWAKIMDELGDYALSPNSEMMFAPGLAYNQSHRHFSNMMAIYPLGMINWEDSEKSQRIIKNSIHLLDSIGPAYWCGYSYAWLASLKARAKDGDGAANDLQIFAKAFCSPNSFHLNGDQTKSGYSKYQYRPFTLEGNFAFAAGLQEMVIQSYAGFINVMPALPASWKNISFENLRAEGAFLVSAAKENGITSYIKIVSEKGGECTVETDIPVNQIKVSGKAIAKITLGKNSKTRIDLKTAPRGVVYISNNLQKSGN